MKRKTKERSRRFAAAAVAVCLGIGGMALRPTPAMAAPWYSRFDLNRDGTINGLDVAFAMDYYMMTNKDAGWDDVAERCDVSGDGKVDIVDLVLIYANFSGDYTTTHQLDAGHVAQGLEYMVTLGAAGVAPYSEVEITIAYDPALLQLLNIAEQAYGTYAAPGEIPGTGITATSVTPGEIKLTLARSEHRSGIWSGDITVLKFKALDSGLAVVDATFVWNY